jgi:hypothetical protein
VTDQRDETGISNQQDDDEGMGGQDIGTDWTMGPGNTGTDPTESDHGGSADNDGGTSGDYVGGGSEDGNSR